MKRENFHTVDLTEPEICMMIEVLKSDCITSTFSEQDFEDVESMEYYHHRAKVLQMLRGLPQ
jgi:tRNA(Ser,Leu) C12 N-acetylase TAN1